MARDWTRAEDYDDVDRLDPSGLAWEFARRNADLRAALARAEPELSPWGLAAWADPDRTALETAVWWRWDFAPGVVVAMAPSALGVARADLDRCALEQDGSQLRMPNGLQVITADAVRQAALVPPDDDLPSRLLAVRELRRGLSGAWPAPRLPPRWRRARLRALLRAHDGRAEGASYRTISAHVLGETFSQSAEWRDSSARGVAVRLVQSARGLVRGGYALLLRLSGG